MHNNPLIYADPTGNWCTSADGNWAHPGSPNDCSSPNSTYEADYLHDGDSILKKGNEVGTYIHKDGAREDNSWTGFVFDSVITLGAGGLGKSAVKTISKCLEVKLTTQSKPQLICCFMEAEQENLI